MGVRVPGSCFRSADSIPAGLGALFGGEGEPTCAGGLHLFQQLTTLPLGIGAVFVPLCGVQASREAAVTECWGWMLRSF